MKQPVKIKDIGLIKNYSKVNCGASTRSVSHHQKYFAS